MFKIIIELFVLGVVSSYSFCAVKCLPAILLYIPAVNRTPLKNFFTALSFLLTRTIIYSIYGSLAAIMGIYITQQFNIHHNIFNNFAGIIIIVVGLFIIIKGYSVKCCYNKNKFTDKFNHILKTSPVLGASFLGVANSLVPCPPLLVVLTFIAVNSENILSGFIFGTAFGTGKIISPILILAPCIGLFHNKIKSFKLNNDLLRIFLGILIVLFGISILV